ncbi:hypothetical protein GCM10023175_58760 [Pseudonocardia xishanensis]|uniref:DUF222 domain-containing protein n=1 Tax=Pseudonocardia xishanensis TaxID=630995 RepID=A0ABP8S0W1_9PSEU
MFTRVVQGWRRGLVRLRIHRDPALGPLTPGCPGGSTRPRDLRDPICDGAGERLPDPRSAAERDCDAVVELARRMLQIGELPTGNGNRPQVTVTITLDDLRGSGAGLLEAGDGIGRGVIRAEDARRIACDAGVVPVVLGSDGEPFDVDRKHRIVHTALRRALAVRDGGCAFPGCGIPARWTDAHHIQHWAHGGETTLAKSCCVRAVTACSTTATGPCRSTKGWRCSTHPPGPGHHQATTPGTDQT